MSHTKTSSWKPVLFALAILFCFYEADATTSPLRIEAVRIGLDMKLTCINEQGTDEANIVDMRWERPEGTIIGHGSELYLKNVQDQDVGQYICRLIENVDSSLVQHKVVEFIERSNLLFPYYNSL